MRVESAKQPAPTSGRASRKRLPRKLKTISAMTSTSAMDHLPRRSSQSNERLRWVAVEAPDDVATTSCSRHIQSSFVSGNPIENSETVAARSQSPSAASVRASPRMECSSPQRPKCRVSTAGKVNPGTKRTLAMSNSPVVAGVDLLLSTRRMIAFSQRKRAE